MHMPLGTVPGRRNGSGLTGVWEPGDRPLPPPISPSEGRMRCDSAWPRPARGLRRRVRAPDSTCTACPSCLARGDDGSTAARPRLDDTRSPHRPASRPPHPPLAALPIARAGNTVLVGIDAPPRHAGTGRLHSNRPPVGHRACGRTHVSRSADRLARAGAHACVSHRPGRHRVARRRPAPTTGAFGSRHMRHADHRSSSPQPPATSSEVRP